MSEESACGPMKGYFVDADSGSLQLTAEYSVLQSERSLAGRELVDDAVYVAHRNRCKAFTEATAATAMTPLWTQQSVSRTTTRPTRWQRSASATASANSWSRLKWLLVSNRARSTRRSPREPEPQRRACAGATSWRHLSPRRRGSPPLRSQDRKSHVAFRSLSVLRVPSFVSARPRDHVVSGTCLVFGFRRSVFETERDARWSRVPRSRALLLGGAFGDCFTHGRHYAAPPLSRFSRAAIATWQLRCLVERARHSALNSPLSSQAWSPRGVHAACTRGARGARRHGRWWSLGWSNVRAAFALRSSVCRPPRQAATHPK